MKENNCPLCFQSLEVRDVTPCEECGAEKSELKHLHKHNYNEYEVFEGLNLILCDFCDVDFGSYDPEFFGLERKGNVGFENMNFIREITHKRLSKDKYCTNCGYRLSFLRFVEKARNNFSS